MMNYGRYKWVVYTSEEGAVDKDGILDANVFDDSFEMNLTLRDIKYLKESYNATKIYLAYGMETSPHCDDDDEDYKVMDHLVNLNRFIRVYFECEIGGETRLLTPIYCEYEWYLIDDGLILDRFENGSWVRGKLEEIYIYKAYYGLTGFFFVPMTYENGGIYNSIPTLELDGKLESLEKQYINKFLDFLGPDVKDYLNKMLRQI